MNRMEDEIKTMKSFSNTTDQKLQKTESLVLRLMDDIRKLKTKKNDYEKKIETLMKQIKEKDKLIESQHQTIQSLLSQLESYKQLLREHEVQEKQKMIEQQEEFQKKQEKTEEELSDLRAQVAKFVEVVNDLENQITQREQRIAQLNCCEPRTCSKGFNDDSASD